MNSPQQFHINIFHKIYNKNIQTPHMPSFSVGKQKKSSSFIPRNNFPGVGAYQTQKRSFDSTIVNSPSYAIGKSKKAKTQKSEGPGPNIYHPERNSCFERKDRGFHITGKIKFKTSTDVPGPAHYDIFRPSKTRQFSFGVKLQQNNKKINFPGPSTYSTELVNRSPTYSFEKSKRTEPGYETMRIPGPGSYEKHDRSKLGYSFGKGEKFQQMKYERRMKEYPGQFNYNTYNINIIKKKTMALRFGKDKRESSPENLNPGPAHYSIKTIEHVSPRAIIGNSPRSNANSKHRSPGPADYQTLRIDKIFKKQPQVKFSKSPRNPQKQSGSPGPGTYQVIMRQSLRSFRMTGRNSIEEKKKSPGPQDYSPNYDNLLKKTQAYKIRERTQVARISKNPGPGDYDLKDALKKERLFSFKKEVKREKVNRNPGPGAYEIKGIIGQDSKR